MKLEEVTIKNFRLLTNIVKLKLDEISTVIVGKNNTGKTSFTTIFEMFMGGKEPSFDDFSLETHSKFIRLYKIFENITPENEEKTLTIIQKYIPKISLILKYSFDTTKDSYTNLQPFMVDLSGGDYVSILLEYAPKDSKGFLDVIAKTMKESQADTKETTDMHSTLQAAERVVLVEEAEIEPEETKQQKKFSIKKQIIEIIRTHINKHYHLIISPYSETIRAEPVTLKDVNNLIKCNFINAQRRVDDSNIENGVKLSGVFEKHYKHKNKDVAQTSNQLLKNTITNTNQKIDDNLGVFFKEFIEAFEGFGFPSINEEKVELKSRLDEEKLFKNHVKLYYNNNDSLLPEKYNGLGYSNLIYIISQILWFQNVYEEIKVSHCLIFIEEPEAHMHPQMQNVFIQNINKFLKKKNFNAQIIITTHSSHILSNAKFESIRYFTKNKGKTIAKDLMNFKPKSDEVKKFLEQYLTLGNSDLFFADKAILFEGTVERLLMPVFIKKMDEKENTKLSSQYIAYIEVGNAYMENFKDLLGFLEVKTLIITDIDSVGSDDRKIEITNDATLKTSNATLNSWIPNEENILELLKKGEQEKIFDTIKVAYQTNVEQLPIIKCGRSFEEAFIIENLEYIFNNKDTIKSIKYAIKNYTNKRDVYENSYGLLDFIDRNKKKTDFAFDLLMVEQNSWVVPTYIKEGLLWLSE